MRDRIIAGLRRLGRFGCGPRRVDGRGLIHSEIPERWREFELGFLSLRDGSEIYFTGDSSYVPDMLRRAAYNLDLRPGARLDELRLESASVSRPEGTVRMVMRYRDDSAALREIIGPPPCSYCRGIHPHHDPLCPLQGGPGSLAAAVEFLNRRRDPSAG